MQPHIKGSQCKTNCKTLIWTQCKHIGYKGIKPKRTKTIWLYHIMDITIGGELNKSIKLDIKSHKTKSLDIKTAKRTNKGIV